MFTLRCIYLNNDFPPILFRYRHRTLFPCTLLPGVMIVGPYLVLYGVYLCFVDNPVSRIVGLRRDHIQGVNVNVNVLYTALSKS